VNQCSNCRFWTPYGEELTDDPNVFNDRYFDVREVLWADGVEWDDTAQRAAELAANAPMPWGTCERENKQPTPMYTNDGSGYFHALRTRHDFGCTAFEDKNSPGDPQ
jgi:hypothetical protein